MNVDFGRAALDYARHRAGFPDRFYEALAARGIRPAAGADRALDIATGTGTIAGALTRRGWRADGIDRSADMLARDVPEDPLVLPHQVMAIVARRQ